jgi:hypothetical protein
MLILPALAPQFQCVFPATGHRPRSRTLALVSADPAGDPGTDHRLADFEPAARHCDLVWRGHCPIALLHLYGVSEAALGGGLGGPRCMNIVGNINQFIISY